MNSSSDSWYAFTLPESVWLCASSHISRQRQGGKVDNESGRRAGWKKRRAGEGERAREEKQKPPDSLGDLKSSRLWSLSYGR